MLLARQIRLLAPTWYRPEMGLACIHPRRCGAAGATRRMRRSSRLLEKRSTAEDIQSISKAPTINCLPDDQLTAVLVLLEEDGRARTTDQAAHAAVAEARRVCCAWRALIDTAGFAMQWMDTQCRLSRRASRAVLETLGAAAALPRDSWRVADLIRDLRSSRVPRLDAPLEQEYRDPFVDGHGVAHYSRWDRVKFAEDCLPIVMTLGGLLMVVSFTSQHEPFDVDSAGCDHRAGFSLHVWTGNPGFTRVLAVTTVDTEYPVAAPPGVSHSLHAGSRMAPLRHVHQAGLDVVCAGAAVAGYGELPPATLLVAICVAALARCGSVEDTALAEGYHVYARIAAAAAAAPTSAPLQHRNVVRGETDQEVFPGLALLYWGAGGASSDELKRTLALELARWRPGIAEGCGWWPAGYEEWPAVASAIGFSQSPVRGCQVCCSACVRRLTRKQHLRINRLRLVNLGILLDADGRRL